MLTITGFMIIESGPTEYLLTEIDELVEKTRSEPGCINYDFHQSLDDSTRFIFYENFADQAAFDYHLAQPHTQAWIKMAEAHGATFDVKRWKMLSRLAGH